MPEYRGPEVRPKLLGADFRQLDDPPIVICFLDRNYLYKSIYALPSRHAG